MHYCLHIPYSSAFFPSVIIWRRILKVQLNRPFYLRPFSSTYPRVTPPSFLSSYSKSPSSQIPHSVSWWLPINPSDRAGGVGGEWGVGVGVGGGRGGGADAASATSDCVHVERNLLLSTVIYCLCPLHVKRRTICDLLIVSTWNLIYIIVDWLWAVGRVHVKPTLRRMFRKLPDTGKPYTVTQSKMVVNMLQDDIGKHAHFQFSDSEINSFQRPPPFRILRLKSGALKAWF